MSFGKEADVTAISLEALTSYLKSSQWTKVPFKDERIIVFEGPTDDFGRPAQLVLPTDARSRDFHKRILEGVQLVALTQSRTIEDVIAEIVLPLFDLMHFRIIHDDSYTLPFDYAARTVNNLKDLFKFGASTEYIPRPVINGKTAIGQGFLKHCRFGQTTKGSFGFTIETYLNQMDLALYEDRDEPRRKVVSDTEAAIVPFERQVVKRIVRGLLDVKVAEEKDDPEPILMNYEHGLNANMCQALSSLFSIERKPVVEVKAVWSPSVKIVDRAYFAPIELDRKSAKLLGKAAKSMSKRREQPESVKLTGHLRELNITTVAETLDGVERERRVVIKGKDQKGRAYDQVRVFLQPDSIQVAFKAIDNNHLVDIMGTLEYQGNVLYLKDAHSLEIVD